MIRRALAENPDVLVVGGGPAGSTTAGLLAAEGLRVLLLDRTSFPRPKPCGECLNPGAVAILARLGLLDTVLPLRPAHLRGWTLGLEGGLTVPATFPHARWGLGVRRIDLDEALLRECSRKGVQLRTGWRVDRVVPASPGARGSRPRVTARERNGRSVEFHPRVVIGADGLRSVVARSIGALGHRPRRRILRKVSLTCHVTPPDEWQSTRWHGVGSDGHAEGRGFGPPSRGALRFGRAGTVGLAPVHRDDSLWNATIVLDPGRYGRALAHDALGVFRRRVEQAAPTWTGFRIKAGPWCSGPFDRPTERAVAPGVLLVGDAAGYYDPLTGQGIYRALWSAETAAQAARAIVSGAEGAEEHYDAELRSALAGSRRLQRGIERVVSSRLLGPALGLLSRRPAVANTLVAVTGDLAPVRDLVGPAAWLGLSTSLDAAQDPGEPCR